MQKPHSSPQVQAEALLITAKQLAENGQYDAAVLVLDQILRDVPFSLLYDHRGLLLSLSGRVEEALASFEQALSSEPLGHTAEIYFHRALLYAQEAIYDKALLDIAVARSLCPGKPAYRDAAKQIQLERATGGGVV